MVWHGAEDRALTGATVAWIPSPDAIRAVGELVKRVKRLAGLDAVRVALAGRADDKVRRIGLPLGGMGLFTNMTYQQDLVELGCDAFIAGESDSYAFRFAVEVAQLGIEIEDRRVFRVRVPLDLDLVIRTLVQQLFQIL